MRGGSLHPDPVDGVASGLARAGSQAGRYIRIRSTGSQAGWLGRGRKRVATSGSVLFFRACRGAGPRLGFSDSIPPVGRSGSVPRSCPPVLPVATGFSVGAGINKAPRFPGGLFLVSYSVGLIRVRPNSRSEQYGGRRGSRPPWRPRRSGSSSDRGIPRDRGSGRE